jgi:hypothetical protein
MDNLTLVSADEIPHLLRWITLASRAGWLSPEEADHSCMAVHARAALLFREEAGNSPKNSVTSAGPTERTPLVLKGRGVF